MFAGSKRQTRNASCLLLIGSLVLLPLAVNADESSPVKPAELAPQVIWSSLLTERQKLTSGECDVEVEMLLVSGGEPGQQLAGSTWKYHLFWDHERYRLDLTETRPRNPEEANDYRTSFIDGKYRCIPAFSRPNVIAFEDAKQSTEGPPIEVCQQFIDPRIAGICPDPFSGISRHSFEKLAGLPKALQGLEANVKVVNGEELIELKWIYKGDNFVRTFLLDPKLNFAPREVALSAKNPNGSLFRDTITCEWTLESIPTESDNSTYAFPKTVTFIRSDGGEITEHEISRFSLPRQLNIPIDEATYDWPALGLRAGATVRRSSKSNDREHVTWNGKSFEVWMPKPLDLKNLEIPAPAPPPRSESSYRRAFFWVNLGVVLTCAGYYLLMRLRTRRAIEK